MATKSTSTKKPPAKSAGGKATAAQSRAAARERANQQLWAIIVFALGVLFASITLVKGQNVWLWVHNLVLGLFGWSSYLIAPLFFYIAIMATLDKPLGTIKHKVWQTFVLVGFISGAVQIFGQGIPDVSGLLPRAAELYAAGAELKGGGVVSMLFGLPFIHWFGDTGAKITIVLLIFVFIMILTGGTLIGLYLSASRPVKKIEEVYTERVAQRNQQMEENRPRFNIDVPLDGEAAMPAHPVASPKGTVGEQRSRRAKDKLLDAFAADAPPPIPIPEPQAPPVVQIPFVEDDPLLEDVPLFHEEEEPEQVPPEEAALDKLISSALPEDPPTPPQPLIQMQTPPPLIETLRPMEPEPFKRFEEGLIQEQEEQPNVYAFPPVYLLSEAKTEVNPHLSEELKANAEKLVDTLKSFGVQTRVIDISRGPAVTRYELQPSAGVKISKITGLSDDIALNLAASGVRIEAPIPNKAAVGIEIPNKKISVVKIREIIDSGEFLGASSRLTVALGKDIAGSVTIADLSKMPHTLIAGSTGSGKSVCINSLIMSILYKATPDEVKLLMVDPKMVELGIYNGIPHLLVPVVTDPKKAAGALGWAVNEMLGRYQIFKENAVRDLTGYNRIAATSDTLQPMPQIVIIIDELADLMMAAPNEVEDSICRLAQMARAAGMHLVIATQRPSVDVITGIIKANIPSRIAFAVSSQVDSRTILDSAGAEKLLGRGDMLFCPVGASKPIRVQGCFVTDEEVERVVEFVKNGDTPPEYDQQIIEEIDRQAVMEKKKGGSSSGSGSGGFEDEDEMLPSAIECVVEGGQASTSLLQRRLKLGYARAARIIDTMEERGIVGPSEGSKPRQVLISKERWIEMKLGATQRAREEW